MASKFKGNIAFSDLQGTGAPGALESLHVSVLFLFCLAYEYKQKYQPTLMLVLDSFANYNHMLAMNENKSW